MKITVSEKQPGFGLPTFVFFAMLAASAAYTASVFNTPMMWVGLGACGLSCLGFFSSTWRHELIMQIDDTGIYDRRLSIGKIHWADVADVQVQETELNRFLCFKMRDASPYLAKLKGANRERVMFHRQLGFT